MKTLGKVLLGIVGLVVLAVGVLFALSSRAVGKKYEVTAHPVAVPTDSASLARGAHLVEAVVACRDCHGENLGGGALAMGPVGTFVGPNLTSGQGGVAGAEIERLELAIRHGVRPDGTPLLFMPAEAYTHLSDTDLGAVIGYLRSQPAVDTTQVATTLGPIGRLILARDAKAFIAAEVVDHGATPPASVTPERSVAYGQYLANIGGCTSCHQANLKRGLELGPPGTPKTADLSATGRMRQWSEEQFREAMRTGVRPDQTTINPFMPWRAYRHMTDDELGAIYDFLKAAS